MNPKIRSPINKNVEPLIISALIGFKQGMYDKKYTPITNKAILFKIFLHFFGFTKYFSSLFLYYLSFVSIHFYKTFRPFTVSLKVVPSISADFLQSIIRPRKISK